MKAKQVPLTPESLSELRQMLQAGYNLGFNPMPVMRKIISSADFCCLKSWKNNRKARREDVVVVVLEKGTVPARVKTIGLWKSGPDGSYEGAKCLFEL